MKLETGALLADNTVIVAGGAGRLGKAFCAAIARQGGYPVVADRDLAQSEAAAQAIAQETGRPVGVAQLDITSTDSVEAMIAQVHADRGRIDAVVNSAYPRNANYGRKFEEVTYQDFSENLSQHVAGMFLVSQRLAAYFEREKVPGNIVNIASIYGVMAPRFEVYEGTPMTMPVEYAAIKSAVIHLTRYMAKYFYGKGLRANVISPGGILDGQPEPFLDKYRSFCASKGMLDKDDISGTLVFLLSNLSEHITGQNIVVDDGFSL
ncbi:SDR family oxidoreductase [Sphingomonas sp. R-74633]|uniref:oxidoreductase n=1 Tax=Sphingomonas sp. R-74633 TaxID=2751188 RepID=UPI0015D32D00|nr:oxidoreductase [Sphingomonas sp. R-74633]NYT39225.1 SDR family oxidoreductase [Sphingomonas sp. R-74633]